MRWQLWLWFIGMIVTTFPWHYAGVLGMPRRMAYFDFTNPAIHPEAITVVMSLVGALILVVSGILFFIVLAAGHRGAPEPAPKFEFALAVHPPRTLPVALNSFGLWIALMIGLTVVNYGFPIAQLLVLRDTSVPAVWVGAQR
jgi:cytochrome c oxidase subunit 1